jgi:hypothetical protein
MKNLQRHLMNSSHFEWDESLFKKDNLVYNKKTKSVSIVRIGDNGKGVVKTDTDNSVSTDDLEIYNPFKNESHQKAKVSPSTEKEITTRGLFNPFK